MINKVIDGLTRIGQNVGGKIKNFFRPNKSVDDAIIAPNGDIISRNPKDFLIATQKPEDLAAGGGGLTININGGIFGSDAAEELGDQIMERLRIVAQT